MRPHEGIEAVFHVCGQHRVAVVKARAAAQAECDRQAVGGGRHVFCQQAVASAGFVQRAHQQGVKHQVGQVGRRAAPQGEWVVFIEGGHPQVAHQLQVTAFGHSGVHVFKVGKTGRILQVAPQCVAVGCPCRRACHDQPRSNRQGGPGAKEVAGNAHATILLEFSLEIEQWVFSQAKNC